MCKQFGAYFLTIAILLTLTACSFTPNDNRPPLVPPEDKPVTVYMLESDGNITYKYDDNGNIIEKKYGNFEYLFKYDNENTLLTKTEFFKGGSPAITEYSYNSRGVLILETQYYKDEKVSWVEYEYGDKGRLIKHTEHNISADDNSEWTIEYLHHYDAAGNLTKVTFDSNGSCFSYEYDDNDNLIKYSLIVNGESPVDTIEYEYDQFGNVIKQTNYKKGHISKIIQYEYNSDGCPVQAIVTIGDYNIETVHFQYRKITIGHTRAKALQKRYNKTDDLNGYPIVVIVTE